MEQREIVYNKTVETLGLSFPSVVAVVGCGGKTSLIKRLASGYPGKRVLISPTTKMFPVCVEGADCRGNLSPETGKLEALPPEELAVLIPRYDIALLEADGSNSLPCKGWRENEPVVPHYSTHTVGVLTMSALGKAATASCVHNLPLFLALTGLIEGQPITISALREMVCAPGGMFKNSVGSRVLLVNQVEDREGAAVAREFLLAVRESYPGYFAKLVLGSVHHDSWREV